MNESQLLAGIGFTFIMAMVAALLGLAIDGVLLLMAVLIPVELALLVCSYYVLRRLTH